MPMRSVAIPCRQCGFDPNWENTENLAQHVRNIQERDTQEVDEKEVSISEKQKSDKDLTLIRKWVEKGEKTELKEITGESITVKSMWAQFDQLAIIDDVLVMRLEGLNTKLQVLVPMTERRTILSHYHDNRTSAHLGLRKTLAKIRQGYYWPGLQKDVKLYVAGCSFCSQKKPPNKKKRAPMQIVETGFPMERIAMDILCELPVTSGGNKHILVISDYYTKWTECFAMPSIEAKTVAKLLVEEVIVRFGTPYVIHTDQGVQFESNLFQEMCRLLQIQKTRTTPYHPQSDGMAERNNRTILTMLSAFVNEHQNDWGEHLPYISMAYRAAEHETTGNTPNYMMLGREVTTPLDIQYCMPRSIAHIPQNRWAWILKDRMEETHKHVRENVKGAMHRQKKYYDQKLSWQSFQPGDQVFVYFPNVKPGLTTKLACLWRGPFKVIAKITDVTYKINCGRKGKPQVIHVDRIRKKYPQNLPGEKNEQIESHEETVAKDDLPNESMKKDKAMEFDSNKEISDNVGVDSEVQKSGRQKRKPAWLADYETY